jgi:hypothetical protein
MSVLVFLRLQLKKPLKLNRIIELNLTDPLKKIKTTSL